ncbi:MAG: CPBP family intramembrane metalloprotease, partial [Acidimicrobiia bacterium]|nr:CPBP family intramembrane metalloprotease [Acidimicrobiia bacterium]
PWGMGDAAVGTLLTFLVPLLVGGTALAIADADVDDIPLWAVALLQVPLWAGLLGAPLYASYRKGRRSLAGDFGLRFRALDVPLGLAAGVAGQVVLVLVLSVVYDLLGVDAEKVGQTAEELTDGAEGVLDVVLLVLIVGLAAPVFEELFYRGLWLRAIERRAGTKLAVAGSSVLFGVIHLQVYDLLALVGFGLLAALLTVRTGRLGPAIWAHVAFNLTAVIGLLA